MKGLPHDKRLGIMNKEHFNQIADNYIAQFERMNSTPHLEYFKWISFRGFESFRNDFEKGLISVEEFPQRLKEAFKGTGVLIDSQTTCPAAGICKMATYEPETVLKMFQELYSDDNGDLDLRLNRIRDFVGKSDELLKKYANGSWKYQQHITDVIAYLNLYKPAENYLYKYKYANKMAQALEYSDAVQSGQYFSLKKYYSMCDELRQEIVTHTGIMEKHAQRKKFTEGVDDENHLIVYDFIYCALTYDLYEGVEINSPIRKKVTHSKQKEMSTYENEIKELKEKLEKEQERIQEIQHELDQLPDFDLTGTTVKHKRFGYGKVLSQNGNKLEILFDSLKESKKIVIPDAVAKGFLILQDERQNAVCKEKAEWNAKADEHGRNVRYLELKISSLENQS